jgi:DNA-binding response OmpR family regulator
LAARKEALINIHGNAMAWGNAMNKRRIFVVDDDADLRKTLGEQLSHYREFELAEAGTATEALNKVRDGHVDLMLLDVGLPDMDGREAVKILRREGFKSPILMLTGQVSDADEILGLESGANDYVTKPFRFSVLLARIRAALRQHDQSEDVVFTIGHYSFHPAQKLLENGEGNKIRLTDKETSILKYLYRQGPKTIGRDVLLKEVWGYNNRVTTHTLETHIYRLRQKIERDPSNARLLVTEEGGYRLVP